MDYRSLGLLAALVLVSGCTSTAGPVGDAETGEFSLYVSDQPSVISSFDRLNVTFDRARIFSQRFSNSSVRTFPVNSTVDLTGVEGDDAEKVLEEDLKPGSYRKVELHTADILGVVENETVDVKVPNEELMITKGFDVSVDRKTEFVFDITVVKEGSEGYNLVPVTSESGVVGKEIEISD